MILRFRNLFKTASAVATTAGDAETPPCDHPEDHQWRLWASGANKMRYPVRICRKCGRLSFDHDHLASFSKAFRLSPAPNRGWMDLSKSWLAKSVPAGCFDFFKGHDVSGEPRDDKGKWAKYGADHIKKVADLYDQGRSYREISDETGIPYGSIGRLHRMAGGAARSKSQAQIIRSSPEVEKHVVQYALEGKRWVDIRADLGVSKIRAERILRGAGVTKAPAPRGLSEAVHKEVLRLYRDNLDSCAEISKEMGVSEPFVYQVINRAGVIRSRSESAAIATQKQREAGKRVGPQGITAPWYSDKNKEWFIAHSSYEIVRMSQLDEDDSVLKWRKNAPIVPYGQGRHYVPDFLVQDKDGKERVEEVKPIWQLNDPVTKQKIDAAKSYFEAQGVGYRVLTERDIGIDALQNFDYDELPYLTNEQRDRLAKAVRQVRVAKWAQKRDEDLNKSVPAGCYKSPASCNLRWITLHPNGDDTTGVPALVHDNGQEYTIVGGAGHKLDHRVFQKPKGADNARAKKPRAAKPKPEGEAAEALTQKAEATESEAKQRERELTERVLAKLSEKGITSGEGGGESGQAGNFIDSIRKEAAARAVKEKADATPAEQQEFADHAADIAEKEATKAARQVVEQVLDASAKQMLGDADPNAGAQVKATLNGKQIAKLLGKEEMDELVHQAATITSLKAAAKTIRRALRVGDEAVQRALETAIKPLTPEQAKAQNLDKYLDGQRVDNNVALIQGAEKAGTSMQRRYESAGASDGLNAYTAASTGNAALTPDLVRQIGVSNAARVAAAHLTAEGEDPLKVAESIKTRMGEEGGIAVAACLDRVKQMDALVANAKAAADAGDGTLTKTQASITAANFASAKYRLLNVTRGQLTAASTLAHHLEFESGQPMQISGGATRITAEHQAKGLGLEDGDFKVEHTEHGGGGGYQIVVPADKLHKLARPQSLASAERNQAMDDLRQDVVENPGEWKSAGFNYDHALLQPHHELAVRAIVDHKRTVVNYGAGSGKTSIIYAAAGHLIQTGKADRVLVTMPKKPRAQQEDFEDKDDPDAEGKPTSKPGEKKKFLHPDLVDATQVIEDGKQLQKELAKVKSGETKILIMSPDMMRDHLDELKEAGFGGERSAYFADEAHELSTRLDEGAGAGRARAAQELAKSEYFAPMSGTLIENSGDELWSIMNMVNPDALGGQKAFAEEWKRLAQGRGDFFASEQMRGMRDRLSGDMVSYHQEPNDPQTGEPLELDSRVETVPVHPLQKEAIAKHQAQYQKDRVASDPMIRKAAALRLNERVLRVLNHGVVDPATGERVNPKFEAARRIMAEEKAANPQNRVGMFADELAPLKAAGKAVGGKLVSVTGENNDDQTRAAVGAINDRNNDTDGILLSRAGNYGLNLLGMDHLIKLQPTKTASQEIQLDHRHLRKGQTRNVRSTLLVTDHPFEQKALYRVRQQKLPEVELLSSLADTSGRAAKLADHSKEIAAAAGGAA